MNDKEELLKFLKSKNFMSLATVKGTEPYNCVVYYGIDDDFNIYFVSQLSRDHSKNIKENSKVALTIADSRQKVTDDKIGVQLKGECLLVKNPIEALRALKLWNKANPGVESMINLDNIKNKVIQSRVYRVKPSFAKFFNENLYGKDGIKEIDL